MYRGGWVGICVMRYINKWVGGWMSVHFMRRYGWVGVYGWVGWVDVYVMRVYGGYIRHACILMGARWLGYICQTCK